MAQCLLERIKINIKTNRPTVEKTLTKRCAGMHPKARDSYKKANPGAYTQFFFFLIRQKNPSPERWAVAEAAAEVGGMAAAEVAGGWDGGARERQRASFFDLLSTFCISSFL